MKAKYKEQTFCVYGLVCPIKKEIFYVGRTFDVEARAKSHIGSASKSPLGNYIAKLRKENRHIEIRYVVLQGNLSITEQNAAEKFWIRKLSESHALLNVKCIPSDKPSLEIPVAEYEKLSGKSISKLKRA